MSSSYLFWGKAMKKKLGLVLWLGLGLGLGLGLRFTYYISF